MHVLTKIFVVLVALLAVALVPLVAVHATNEGTYKRKYLDEQNKAAAAASALQAEQSTRQASEAAANAAVQLLETRVASLQKDVDTRTASIRKLESDLAASKSMQASINTNLEIMAQTGKAGNELTESLVTEVRALRSKNVDSEKQLVELNDAVANLQSQLEVADAARRALQEEVQRLTQEKMAANDLIAQYVATVGELPGPSAGALRNSASVVPADRDLSATVTAVSHSGEATLAEIAAGSRDGVKVGWLMSIGEDGSFVGNLRIISVDVNTATGIVELENPGMSVRVGQRAIARRGE